MRADVLNHGFVELLDVMGTDETIVEAARVSYDNSRRPPVSDARTLLRYLMRHEHLSPFEMPVLRFKVHCPIGVARQWQRHRTWSFSEASTRYAAPCEDVEVPDPLSWRRQSSSNKQGSAGPLTDDYPRTARALEVTSAARECYSQLVGRGVALEQARDVLPIGTYTTFIGQVNLRNLLAFLMLRLDPHAQYEIRVYADAMVEMVADRFPLTWEAFVDYRLEAVTLSRQEVEAFRRTLDEYECGFFLDDWLTSSRVALTSRERDELAAKLVRFGYQRKTEVAT